MLQLFVPQAGPWVKQALCAQTDPEAFFPEKGGSTREAKRICRRCDVAAECLDYALSHDEQFGIWGGMSERDRRKLANTVLVDDTLTHDTYETGTEFTQEIA